jgi:hypothetical protein
VDVDKPAAIVTLSTVADGRRPRAAGDRLVKVPGQQVSQVPTEPRRGQVIALMAAFKASLEKRGIAAPTAGKGETRRSRRRREARPEAHARTARPAV